MLLQELEKEPIKAVSPHSITHSIDKLLEPIDLIIQQKILKAYYIVLSILQALAVADLLSLAQKLVFINMARRIVDSNEEMMMIKVIQILLIAINRLHVTKIPFANKVLELSLKLFAHKSNFVKNNIFVVLRQMYSLLFEQYVSKLKTQTPDNPERVENSELHKICYDQLKQLIALNSDKSNQISFKGLGMDMVSLILSEYSLIGSAQILELIEKLYTPCLNIYFSTEMDNYSIITRTVKSAVQVVSTLEISYNLLQPIIYLTKKEYTWQWYLALEAFNTILSKPKQLQNMNSFTNDITNTKVTFLLNLVIS